MNWRWQPLTRALQDANRWLLPLIAANMLCILLGLTVILLPPAIAALYAVADQAYQGETPQLQTLWRAVRRWGLVSWLWALASLLLLAAYAIASSFYSQQSSPLAVFMFAGSTVFSLTVWLCQFFFWPYMLLQAQSAPRPAPWLAARNALFTVLGDPLYVLGYAGLSGLLLLLSVLSLVPFAVIAPVFLAMLAVYSLRDWLDHHHPAPTEP